VVTIEVLLYAPLLALLTFIPIQLALWGAALVGARAAADGTARDTAAYGATTQDGQASAQDRLHAIAGHLLQNPSIAIQRDQNTAAVTVSGSSALLPLPVTWTAVAPVERFTVISRGFANSDGSAVTNLSAGGP
jgi:hypothetical protein